MYSCLSAGDDEGEKKQNEGNKKANENVKLFCRPQFLEFLIRLALQKWCIAPIKPKPKKPIQ